MDKTSENSDGTATMGVASNRWWRWPVFILWYLSPAILMVASVVPGHEPSDVARQPSTKFGSALFGIGLFGSPLILFCAAMTSIRIKNWTFRAPAVVGLTMLLLIVNFFIAEAGCNSVYPYTPRFERTKSRVTQHPNG